MTDRETIRYIDLGAEYAAIRAQVQQCLEQVFAAGDFILRDEVRRFETSICKLTGAVHAVGVNSGFDALRLSLECLELAPGDEVIVPAYTFIATAAAVVEAGGVPVFADCGEDLNIDPLEISRLVSSRTRAVIPVHLHGRPCDMDTIMDLSRDWGLAVIEDACQAFGSTLHQRAVGTFGDFGCFSLHPLKSLSVPGDGGFILTGNDRHADRLRCRRDHGRKEGKYIMPGVNSRLDNLHASVANLKLEHFSDWAAARGSAARRYAQALAHVPGVKTLPEPGGAEVVWSCYPLICDGARDLRDVLHEAGIEHLPGFDPPVHKLPPFVSKTVLPRAERLAPMVTLLPMHPFLKPLEITRVAQAVKDAVL